MATAELQLEGPVGGRSATVLEQFNLAAQGYVGEEWFFSGRAVRYEAPGDLAPDGCWSVRSGASAPFRSRLLVRRPADGARFNGTVVLEWLNVSAGTDIAPAWTQTHRELMRSGVAFVGVSAQRAGIDGGGVVPGPHLKLVDPERYTTLQHPGDAWSFDIFNCAARVLRENATLLGGRVAERVLASGESQSAAFLVTYLNAVDPLVRLVDGCLLTGRTPLGAPLDGTVLGAGERLDLKSFAQGFAHGHRIREDVRVPVIIVQTETDLIVLGAMLARQPDSERIRSWEIAGAAHADSYGQAAAHFDDGTLAPALLAKLLTPTMAPSGMPVARPINAGPQKHYVLQAAIRRLEQWVNEGTPAPCATRLDTDPGSGLARDAFGIVVGGVRTPWVEVPAWILSGLGQEGEVFGMLWGTTAPLPFAQLFARYPGGRAQYAREFAEATQRAVAAGFLLAEDAVEINGVGVATWPFWPRA